MAKVAVASPQPGRRGRPQKYGGPSQMVAVTLPRQVVATLSRLHSDLGWAIVALVEKTRQASPLSASKPGPDVQLVEVGDDQFLIVVNSAIFRGLPGVQIIPLSATQAFLALDPGRGIADLELAVLDRLQQLKTTSRERRALVHLRSQLRDWRRDPQLESHARSIIIVTKRKSTK